MKNKKWQQVFCFILLCLLVLPGGTYAAPVNETEIMTDPNRESYFQLSIPPEIVAQSAMLTESQRGQILYQKNATTRLHSAVACKLMTLLILVDRIEKNGIKLDTKVTISKQAAEAPGKVISLEVGAKYTLEDLLYATMLTSANNAAIALAEFASGDVEKFVEEMNAKAAELNMRDTYFANPTGLFDERQYTTAYDLSLMIKYALNFPLYNKLFSSRIKLFSMEDGRTEIIRNQNNLFWSYDNVDGGKLGYNDKQHQSLVTTATQGNQRLICVTLDSPEEGIYEDTKKLLNYGFSNFRTGILVHKNYVHKYYEINGQRVNLVNINDVYYTYPIGQSFIKDVILNVPDALELPVTTSKIVGTAKYILNDNTTIEVNLYPDREISPPDDFYTKVYKKIRENRDILLLVVFLILIEILLILINLFKWISKLFRKSAGSPGQKAK